MMDVERTRPRQWRSPRHINTTTTTVDKLEISPDSDILEGMAYRLLLALAGRSLGTDQGAVHCYAPSGKLVGTVSAPRLTSLWHRWRVTRETVGRNVPLEEFVEDVGHLLSRYT